MISSCLQSKVLSKDRQGSYGSDLDQEGIEIVSMIDASSTSSSSASQINRHSVTFEMD
jgi:hypothetical protein